MRVVSLCHDRLRLTTFVAQVPEDSPLCDLDAMMHVCVRVPGHDQEHACECGVLWDAPPPRPFGVNGTLPERQPQRAIDAPR